MSAFDLYPVESDARLRDMMRNPEPGPDAFDNVGGAITASMQAAPLEALRAMSPLIDAYGKAGAFRDASMIAQIEGKDAPDLVKLKKETIDRIGQNDLRADITPEINRLTPDPVVTGTASQIVFGFGKTVGKAIGYSMLGGNVGGAAMFGADEGVNETYRLQDKGVDDNTAALSGAVHGVVSGISAALPVMGKTKIQTAGIVAAGGPGSYISEQATIKEILKTEKYDRIAEDYKPFDPAGLIVSTAAPAVFGIAAHAARGQPIGIRNNNPGNLVKSGISWNGKVPGKDAKFETFATAEHGIAALARNLISYQEKHGLDTVQDIIKRWAPPNENKTGAYASAVAKALGVKVTDKISLNDGATLEKLTTAIIRHENGSNPYNANQISSAVRSAIDGTAIKPTPEQIDAARVANLAAHSESRSLARGDDIAGANSNIKAINEAARLIDEGEPVKVHDIVRAEQTKLDDAYSTVLADHRGIADDPMVMIRPDDIEAVAISRGGWKGLGDVEVKGQGFGLVKFIWRHGEESSKPAGFQITREDIKAFPKVAREFEPTIIQNNDGTNYREWRVDLPDDSGRMRQVVFVDKQIGNDQLRHVISTYIQEPGKSGDGIAPSNRKTDLNPESSGKWADTRAGDTQSGLLRQAGQDQSVQNSIAAISQDLIDGAMLAAPAMSRLKGFDQAAFDEFSAQINEAFRVIDGMRNDGYSLQHVLGELQKENLVTPEINNLIVGIGDALDNPKRISALISRIADELQKPSNIPRTDMIANAVEDTRIDPGYESGNSAKDADTPEINAAYQAIADDPAKIVPTGELAPDGTPIVKSAAELMAEADDSIRAAEDDSNGIAAAITCFLRG